jgi:Cupin domain
MATNIYDLCTNPVTGEAFRAISIDTYVFKMRWHTKPGVQHSGSEHIHKRQDEIFYVKKGELRLLVDGKEFKAGPGEKIIVGKGKAHVVLNTTCELDILLEYRPALDYDKLLQCFEGLLNDGYTDEQGRVDIRMLGYMMRKMRCKSVTRPAGMSAFKFNMALNAFYMQGKLKGWSKLYDKYTK